MVRTSVTHSAIASCATFLFLPHFDVICDLLLNRRTATWNLFVKLTPDPDRDTLYSSVNLLCLEFEDCCGSHSSAVKFVGYPLKLTS